MGRPLPPGSTTGTVSGPNHRTGVTLGVRVSSRGECDLDEHVVVPLHQVEVLHALGRVAQALRLDVPFAPVTVPLVPGCSKDTSLSPTLPPRTFRVGPPSPSACTLYAPKPTAEPTHTLYPFFSLSEDPNPSWESERSQFSVWTYRVP